MIDKIISGGQTGADRAALDFAIAHNIPYGGWLPKGRKTEDGTLPNHYQLQEMPTPDYSKRTEKNVLEGEGTVITVELPVDNVRPAERVSDNGIHDSEAPSRLKDYLNVKEDESEVSS